MGVPLLGNSATVLQLSQAFYGVAPSYASYTTNLAYVGANGNTLYAAAIAQQNQFASLSDAAFSQLLITNLGLTAFGTGATVDLQTALTAYITANEVGATNTASVRGTIALQLASLLSGLEGATGVQAVYAPAAVAFNAQQTNAYVYSTNTANTSPAVVATSIGQTFTLTTGVDGPTNFVGGSANDTFNAGTSASLSAFDNLDGGAGTDTLSALITTAALPGSLTVKNIETATINTTGAGFSDTFTGWTGLTSLTVQDATAGVIALTTAATTAVTVSSTGASSVRIDGGGVSAQVAGTAGGTAVDIGKTGAVINAFKSITLSGGSSTVDISDNKTAAANSGLGTTLTTVSISDNTGAINIKAAGLTSLTLANEAQSATITNATAHALALNLNTVTGGTIADAGATSIAIANTVGTSSGITVQAGAATAVTVSATTKALTLAALTAGVATKVGVSGDAAVTITVDTLAAAAVVTSTNTKGVTLTQDLLAGQQFVGTASSGADAVGVATTWTTAITTGDGNDTVTYNGAAGSGGTIDAGAGTGDIISMIGATAETATGSTTFAGTVSNFEVLSLSAITGAARTINMANADGINSMTYAGSSVGTLAITNAAANFTLTQTVANTAAVSVGLASDAGLTDNVNLVYKAADGFTNGALATTIANVENLTITTTDTSPTAMTNTAVTAIITATAVQNVTVAGSFGIDLTGLTATTLTKLDASGLTLATADSTTGGLAWTSGALAASSTILGSAVGTNAVTFSAASTASTFVTYTGGAGTDTVVGSNGMNNVVNLGNGTNSYTQVGAGDATVTGGTGADTISVGTGANTINVGGGTTANSVTVGAAAGLNVITTTSTGVDTIILGGIQTAAGYYTSVTGLAAGDKIDFSGVTTGARADAALGAKVVLGGAVSFANYLDACAAGAGNVNALMKWFQYTDGNTYIVVDNSATATFADGVDSVIQLTGLVTLTTAATVADVLTLV